MNGSIITNSDIVCISKDDTNDKKRTEKRDKSHDVPHQKNTDGFICTYSSHVADYVEPLIFISQRWLHIVIASPNTIRAVLNRALPNSGIRTLE